jgi:hypothetical protein
MEERLDYDELISKYKKTVVIRLRGSFYNAFDESAFILSFLMGYKVKKISETAKCKCGFPSNALEKVISVFNTEMVDYVILDASKIVAQKEFFSDNKYDDILNSFDINTVEVGTKISSTNKKRQITFNCPDKIAEELEQFIGAYNSYFGPVGYNRDFVISWLLSVGLKNMDNFPADNKK